MNDFHVYDWLFVGRGPIAYKNYTRKKTGGRLGAMVSRFSSGVVKVNNTLPNGFFELESGKKRCQGYVSSFTEFSQLHIGISLERVG